VCGLHWGGGNHGASNLNCFNHRAFFTACCKYFRCRESVERKYKTYISIISLLSNV
jgi:hypothetical protein